MQTVYWGVLRNHTMRVREQDWGERGADDDAVDTEA